MLPRLRVFSVGASRLMPSSGALVPAGAADGMVPAGGRHGEALLLAPKLGGAGDRVSAKRSPCIELDALPWWPMPKRRKEGRGMIASGLDPMRLR